MPNLRPCPRVRKREIVSGSKIAHNRPVGAAWRIAGGMHRLSGADGFGQEARIQARSGSTTVQIRGEFLFET